MVSQIHVRNIREDVANQRVVECTQVERLDENLHIRSPSEIRQHDFSLCELSG
jgi:hypothetical protein